MSNRQLEIDACADAGLTRLAQYALGATVAKLSAVVHVVPGAPNMRKKDLQPGGIPLLGTGIKPKAYVNQANHTGELVAICTRGESCGEVVWWDEPVFVTDTLAMVGNQELMLTRYLYYVLDAKSNELNKRKKGCVIPEIKADDVLALEITLPNLDRQRRIIRVLDTMSTKDDKRIELVDQLRECVTKTAFQFEKR